MENMIRDIIYLVAMDQELDIINLANAVGEDLGCPLPYVVCRRQNKRRKQSYFKVKIPRYTDVQFLEHFGMSRGMFEELLKIVASAMNKEENVSISNKLMFTIWALVTFESLLSVSERFDLVKSTAYRIYVDVINALTQLMSVYIKWPTVTQCRLSSDIFEARSHGFKGVISVIDSCHIICKQPVENSTDYCNKEGNHSIILQGVCDHQGLFVDCFIGMPGRMHNTQVLKNSPLFDAMKMGLIPHNLHIIGDSTYPLLQNLMVPFKDNGCLTESQLSYNAKLSKIQFIIKRTFGALKSKFRRLKYLDVFNIDMGNNMIAAACVLHNFILNRDGGLILEDEDFNVDTVIIKKCCKDFTASKKRRRIAEQF